MTCKPASLFIALALSLLITPPVHAHCEIPCGIYDDATRVKILEEHVTTIEKAMNEITQLSGKTPTNHNQVTRWITNKERHANEIQHIVSQYFMTQRIKPDADKYTQKLTLLHKMLVYAMKCKQTTDLANVKTLRSLISEFSDIYLAIAHK